MKKKALITGITGQTGSYLAEFLINKKYIVHGIKRTSSSFNTQRIDHLYTDPLLNRSGNFFLHNADLLDGSSLAKIINTIQPDEIYNLGAQSHVGASFQMPEYTANVNALGTLRILEIIKNSKKKIKFYQASTSEIFGDTKIIPQSEKTIFNPCSPYAASTLFSYNLTKIYRDAYKLFACNGILFNHESKRRGETFVTRKITMGLANIYHGKQKILLLGNLNSKRDWGHAKDFCEMQWKILQNKKPDDFVISTGKQYSVRKFVEIVLHYLGIKIKWIGHGLSEKGVVIKNNKMNNNIKIGQTIIKVHKKYYRPKDVTNLLGNSAKARKILNWKPKIDIYQISKEMIINDLQITKKKFNIK